MALTKIGTDGVKDDAVTSDKVANAINSAIAANTAKTQTTINNNADNRVITGSGTANTLEGESVLTFDSSTDTLQVHQQNSGNNPAFKSISRGGSGSNINAHFTSYSGNSNTVILHDGSVGIGTTNPGQKLEVRQTAASHAVIACNRPNSDTFAVALGNNSGNNGVISVNNTDLLFGRDSSGTFTERMRMRNDGGLTFNGDTAAANALNDYEEGTFTPSFSAGFSYAGTITYSAQAGHYTKIGNQVFAYIYLRPHGNSAHSGNLITDGNNLQVSGLPFACNSISFHEGGGYITYTNGFLGTGSPTNNMDAMPWVSASQSHVIFHTREDGNNVKGNETTPDNRYFIFQVRYHV